MQNDLRDYGIHLETAVKSPDMKLGLIIRLESYMKQFRKIQNTIILTVLKLHIIISFKYESSA